MPMRMQLKLWILAAGLVCPVGVQGEEAPLPQDMAPWFQPPAEFAEKLGNLRSPLRFYDGRPVTSAAEWPQRAEEIRARWHEIMGPWPALIASPKVEVLEEVQRE